MQPSPTTVLRVITGVVTGAIAGVMIVLAAVSLPTFFMPGDDAGLFIFVFGFWAFYIGAPVGAIAGGYAARRGALGRCVMTMIASLFVAPIVLIGADRGSADPLPVDAGGCAYEARTSEFLLGGQVVTVFKRRCPGKPPTVEVSVLPAAQPIDFTAPGNALVLDASADLPDRPVMVYAFGGADSVVTLSYDSRARVLSQQASAGGARLRILPDTASSPGFSPQAVSTAVVRHPCTIEAIDRIDSREMYAIAFQRDCPDSRTLNVSVFEAPRFVEPSHSGNALVLDVPRGADPSRLTTFKRICPGEPATIEVSVVAGSAMLDPKAPGNALVLDASSDYPGDSLLVRVIWAEDSSLTIGYDRRARVVRKASRVNGFGIRLFAATSADMRLGPQKLIEAWSARR